MTYMDSNQNETPNNHEVPHVTAFNIDQKNKIVKKPKTKLLPVVLSIVFSSLIIGGVFYFIRSSPQEPEAGDFTVTENEYTEQERLVPNPITGELATESKSPVWNEIRPLGAMINNHIDARPQSGLIYADLVYEMVAEGGITRFLAFFLSETPEKIGPIRSTREYYLVLVKEMGDAMIMHEGYSPQAQAAIDEWPVRSLFRGGASGLANWRDNPRNVAYEHTLYTDGTVLREVGDSLGWQGNRDFESWNFKDNTEKYSQFPSVNEISIDFWFKGDYSAIFRYKPESNTYLRYMGYDSEGNPLPHADQETQDQIEISNLIVQFVAESAIEGDDKSRLEYQLIGSGTGLVFLDGKVMDVTWTKTDRDSRTKFYDINGDEVFFNRGKFWISIVPDRNVDQVVFN